MTISSAEALKFYNGQRNPDSHKGDFGRAAILGGVRGMTGAGILCSKAALHAGAGLVYIGVIAETAEVFEICVPEAVKYILTEPEADSVRAFAQGKSSLVIGPGMGRSIASREIVCSILLSSHSNEPDYPTVVLDADGLNSIAGFPEILYKGGKNLPNGLIITPHEQEAARLLGTTADYIHENRQDACKELLKMTGGRGTVVLKGHKTLVMSDNFTYENETGNAGMATGGSGDVLAGMMAGFIATDRKNLSIPEIVAFSVYIHGLCGDIAAEKYGQRYMTAGSIVDAMADLKGRNI